MSSESNVKGPWYRDFAIETERALRFIVAFEELRQKFPEATVETFEKETLATFIFESNQLEGEGLSLGDTRELVFSEISNQPRPQTHPSLRVDFASLVGSGIYDSMDALDNLLAGQEALNQIKQLTQDKSTNFHVVHKSKSKEARTVSQYLHAIISADYARLRREFEDKELAIYWMIQSLVVRGMEPGEELRAEYAHRPMVQSLLSEELLKRLHEILAQGLIASKYAPAGHYRNHPVQTDFDSHYPAPEDVPRAMAHFIERFRALESQELNPIVLAAWASTQFVLVHPFSDFNGRMSRLIANMVLRSHGVPFWTSLRSTSTERKRYITALRHYRRDKPRSIATLIAKQVNFNFDEFNRMLETSAYSPIVPVLASPRPTAEQLESYSKPSLSSLKQEKYDRIVEAN